MGGVDEGVDAEAPYGSWPSPITADLVVAAAVSLAQVATGEDDLWWDELRPSEAGRVQIVRHRPGGEATDVLPEGFSARSRVHEYGGGAWWLHQDTVFVVNAADQRIWRLEPDDGLVPLTPAPARTGADRYADGCLTGDARWVICVRERHGEPGSDVINELVAVAAHPGRDGEGHPQEPQEPVVVVSGPDFVSFPRVSPDGRSLCWTQWNHPHMPWDSAELWVADLTVGESAVSVGGAHRVAGGPEEAIFQPSWSTAGDLLFVSDRSGWSNLQRIRAADLDRAGDTGTPQSRRGPEAGGDPAATGRWPIEAIAPVAGEVATPQWVFGLSRYAELADGRILMAVTQDGLDHLAVAVGDGSPPQPLTTPYTALAAITRFGAGAAAIAAGADREPAVVALDVPADPGGPPLIAEVRPPRDLGVDPGWWSRPEPLAFPSTGGRTAHALWYPPANPHWVAPPTERPPLVVLSHGGPTSMARPQLALAVQYWTSRGFGVVDVNYGGSTGFGRAYRRQLDGQWGIVDVDDCVAAAEYLVSTGRVDGDRLIIRGGSAGGFTTLCALTFRDTFRVGSSLYGVADLERLATDTHKFEARYLDGLIGPYPAERQVYIDRSPIHHVDQLNCPVVVFQGLEDEVVPPSQADAIVGALRAKGLPVAYLAFEGEQHGFRQAANIRRVLQAERYFVSTILGVELADDEVIEPVPIPNLDGGS